jgi:hypothetical protein
VTDHLTAGGYLGAYRGSGRDKVLTSKGKAHVTRTIVKANHFSSGGKPGRNSSGGAGMAKANIRYITRRENSEHLKQERDIFTKTDDKVDIQEVRISLSQLSADERFRYGYRIVLSPDTPRETSAQNLNEWTRSVMATVEAHHKVKWFAVVHSGVNGHTNHAHVHVLAVLDRRLGKEELATLRQHGDVQWHDIVSRQKMRAKDHYAQHGSEGKHHQAQANVKRDYSAGFEL